MQSRTQDRTMQSRGWLWHVKNMEYRMQSANNLVLSMILKIMAKVPMRYTISLDVIINRCLYTNCRRYRDTNLRDFTCANSNSFDPRCRLWLRDSSITHARTWEAAGRAMLIWMECDAIIGPRSPITRYVASRVGGDRRRKVVQLPKTRVWGKSCESAARGGIERVSLDSRIFLRRVISPRMISIFALWQQDACVLF